jgi:hypothetical protein
MDKKNKYRHEQKGRKAEKQKERKRNGQTDKMDRETDKTT